ncbi:MAG: SusD/RagB family nutrient-binding outer membrane lipoprotein [Microscillaceae bacterium]|nr:SusD/RagB family nutrient-binding outer membrane lipoprotein [Microscillaceae bacterium]
MANSLKLRIFIQRRLVDANAGDSVVAVLNTGNVITSAADDFVFNYGTNLENPASRHPFFGANYDNGAGDYMSNSYMNRFLNSPSGQTDPRIRYYFYRQETNTSNVAATEYPCIAFPFPSHYDPGDVFCQIGSGYWGRDHGDDSGIPPDDLDRTIWGVYPVGGQFDASNDVNGSQTSGAGGAGLAPILPSFFVDFLRAEAALTLGTGEDARALMESGIRASIAKCISQATLTDPTYTTERSNGLTPQEQFEPNAAAIDIYVNSILALYDAAGNNTARLEVVITEYYKAAFGNGFEAYNMYRRTGFPINLQKTYAVNPGAFIRSFFYPSNYVNVNQNADQKPDVDQEVFWDDRSAVLR